jgi:hypothetical protein
MARKKRERIVGFIDFLLRRHGNAHGRFAAFCIDSVRETGVAVDEYS